MGFVGAERGFGEKGGFKKQFIYNFTIEIETYMNSRIIILSIITVIFCTFSTSSQPIYNNIKNKIGSKISADSKNWKASKYMGNLTLDNVKEEAEHYVSSGTFEYKVLGVGKIYYNAKVKILFDEFNVTKIWWTPPYTGVNYVIGQD